VTDQTTWPPSRSRGPRRGR